MFDPLPFFPHDYEKHLPKKGKKKKGISLPWPSNICSERTSFASPIAKNYWTMTVNYVGLKINLLGTSSSMITLTLFFLM